MYIVLEVKGRLINVMGNLVVASVVIVATFAELIWVDTRVNGGSQAAGSACVRPRPGAWWVHLR